MRQFEYQQRAVLIAQKNVTKEVYGEFCHLEPWLIAGKPNRDEKKERRITSWELSNAGDSLTSSSPQTLRRMWRKIYESVGTWQLQI